jgi:hypothetical protein
MASALIPTEFNLEHRLNPLTMLFIAVLAVFVATKGKKK